MQDARSAVVDALPFLRLVAGDVARASDVDDVVQEVALRLLRRPAVAVDLFRTAREVRGFLRTVTRREAARMQAARGDVALLGESDVAVPAAVVDDEGPPEDLPDLGALTAAQGRAVRLHYFDGLPAAAVARRMRTTPGAVRVMLCRARAALRKGGAR